jgi:molecular chaperone HtpG
MADYIFGANILENLTTGMYQDSKVIYREYIQNACDQIDQAEKLGILPQRNPNQYPPDLGIGEVNIWPQPNIRKITIEDNATGIKASDFQRILGNIADSDKVMGENKGFRGIGRLCGLAYCRQLVFTTRYAGEDIVSIMTCDAEKMREMINDVNVKKIKHTAVEVLEAITVFSTEAVKKDTPQHFFRVELIDINEENEELFGGVDEEGLNELKNYLSFVAPVPYRDAFAYRSKIYDYAKSINSPICEYSIKVEGQDIFKKYKTHLKAGKGDEDIFDIEFHNFTDENSNLIAWMWFGCTEFKGAIKEEEISRGLRLRKENIQIGDSETLRSKFRESRGNSYFIGEIFCVSPALVPNSQRDYFKENPERVNFEHALRQYFDNELHYIYQKGSDINAALTKIESFDKAKEEFEHKEKQGLFTTDGEKERYHKELQDKKQKSIEAFEKIEKLKDKYGDSTETDNSSKKVISEILTRRVSKIPVSTKVVPVKVTSDIHGKKADEPPKEEEYKPKQKYLTDTLFPRKNKAERKLISEVLDKVFEIIQKASDKKTSEQIISKIKEELR